MARTGVTPGRATHLLTASLTLVSVGLVAAGHDGPVLNSSLPGSPLLRVGGLLALFLVAELSMLHVEVRRQAYSATLAGLPLAVGVLTLGAWEVVAARVAGSALAFLIQRVSFSKASYNLAAYAAEAAIDVAVIQLLLGHLDALTVRGALVSYLVIVSVDQVMTGLVLRVMGWHQGGRLSSRMIAESRVPALLASVLATTAAFAVLLLTQHGALGVLVLVVGALSMSLAYRSFQVLHRRHQALEQLHHFVSLTGGFEGTEPVEADSGPDGLAGRLLGQVRSLMHAARAELLLVDAETTVQLCIGEDEVLHVDELVWAADDELVGRVRVAHAPALLTSTTRRVQDRAWLRGRGVADAVIVPLPRGSGEGALLVLDRLGSTGSFTAEDQALLQTLAGHLAVAVRSSALLHQLRYEATHDVLTGLANRSLLQQTLLQDTGGRPGIVGTVLLLDLNRFKEVNDTLGHHVGDALLCTLASTLRSALPAESTVARLGGDEFAAFVPDITDPNAALATAHAVARALAVPVQLPEALLSITASIGVALGAPGRNGADLLRHADTAMYAAKEAGQSVVRYTDELDRGRAEKLALLADLHLAIDRDELFVDYQPKLDLVSGRVDSVEALVRWRHPRLGTLLPGIFIPLAESNEIIAGVTRRVLTVALQQCASWRRDGLDLAVAVNLSARTVNDPALPELVSSSLLHAGVPASRLILEITESSVMDDPDRAVAILSRIAAIGVVLSLDDFGTGYSSLSYLRRLPVREVKIDRSFLSGLVAGEDNSRLLVRGIVSLASSLGHRVVGEGAEDTATVDALRELGCDIAQGYAISRPTSPEQITSFVAALAPPTLRAVRQAR